MRRDAKQQERQRQKERLTGTAGGGHTNVLFHVEQRFALPYPTVHTAVATTHSPVGAVHNLHVDWLGEICANKRSGGIMRSKQLTVGDTSEIGFDTKNRLKPTAAYVIGGV